MSENPFRNIDPTKTAPHAEMVVEQILESTSNLDLSSPDPVERIAQMVTLLSSHVALLATALAGVEEEAGRASGRLPKG